jgi:hypothetical protein
MILDVRESWFTVPQHICCSELLSDTDCLPGLVSNFFTLLSYLPSGAFLTN